MPGEHIDRTAIAEHIERVLRNALPAQADELRDDRLDDPRVAAIDQSIGEAPTPAKLEDGLDLQRRADPAEAVDRDPGKLAALEERNDLLIDISRASEVDLA